MAGPFGLRLGNPVAGPYTATYDGFALGLVEKAWAFRMEAGIDPVRSDYYGATTLIDGIYTGGNAWLLAEFQEWTPAVYGETLIRGAYWPFARWGEVGQVGRRISDVYKQLLLSAVSGAPVSPPPGLPGTIVGPATIRAEIAGLAENNSPEVLFGTVHRVVPVLFRLLPFIDQLAGGTVKWFAVT